MPGTSRPLRKRWCGHERSDGRTPGSDRFATQNPWLDSRHSFSFGRHYDAANTGFGLLLAPRRALCTSCSCGSGPIPSGQTLRTLSWTSRPSSISAGWRQFVAKGSVDLDAAGRLETGDAVRLTAAGGPSVTAVDATAEVLVWEMARENR